MLASFLLVRFSICIKPFFTGSIRYGISNISRRSMHSTIQLIAFGLGVTAVLILTIVRTQLLDTWQSSLPDQTPNFFLINIQSGEEATIKSILSEYSVDAPAFYPITRGRISHVNDIALSDYDAVNEEAEDELRDDINLTWSSSFPVGNELIEGRWWDDNESPQISIAERLLDEIGLSLGDDLTFYLSGQSLTAKITSVRRVDWESFRPNFFMLMNPGFLERLPYTSITSFYLEDVQARQAIMELTDQLPSISSIDIGAVIAQVRSAMQQASLAVQFVFLFTLISAFLVMLTTLHATKRDRIYEGSLIKAIGGNTKTVRTSLLVEFVVIGSLAGLLGSIIAVASGYLLATEVFNIEYQLNWLILPAGICGGGALVGLASLFITRSISSKQPSLLLRESYD
jgi:putative ABC transport system permease protein